MQFLTFSFYHENSADFANVKELQFEDPLYGQTAVNQIPDGQIKPIFKEKR